MKKVLLLIVLLCFAGKADCKVTRKEVQAAKDTFIWHKWINNHQCKVVDGTTIYYDCAPYNEVNNDVVAMDSLYWRGLKAIRHDQKFWIIKK
jgi:hypothetical protein